MKSLQRVIRLSALLIIGASAAGCVVLPYGGGHHRGGGHGHRYGEYQQPTVVIEGHRQRGGSRHREH